MNATKNGKVQAPGKKGLIMGCPTSKKFGKLAKSEAYEEGEEARSLGRSKRDNPYKRGTPSFVQWLKGWNDEDQRGY